MCVGLARWKALVDSLLCCAQYLLALLSPSCMVFCKQNVIKFLVNLLPSSPMFLLKSPGALSLLSASWCTFCFPAAPAVTWPFAPQGTQQWKGQRWEISGHPCRLLWQHLSNSVQFPRQLQGWEQPWFCVCALREQLLAAAGAPCMAAPSQGSRECSHSDLPESITVFEGLIYIFI